MVRMQAKKIKNWTAPGKDEEHDYWLKHLTEIAQSNLADESV